MLHSTPAAPVFLPPPQGAAAVYEAWLTHNNDNATYGREAIDPVLSASYRFIWQAWCKFLCRAYGGTNNPQQAPWQRATERDVVAFLQNGMRRLKHGHPTNTAQRRYWSVLARVYAFAHAQAWVPTNPTQRLAARDMPKSEITFGAVLTPPAYEACLQVLPPLYGTPTEVRDRAMFLLLLMLALTPQEVRELGVRDLERDPTTGAVLYVQIPALRSDAQQRRMAVDALTSEALVQWLGQRPLFASVQEQGCARALFVSQKGPRVTMGTLLHVCRDLILKASERAGRPPPARLGPQVLRNTVLVRWLDAGLEVGVVARMAGLKNAKGLRHLMPHVGQEVRAHLAMADRRDDAPALA